MEKNNVFIFKKCILNNNAKLQLKKNYGDIFKSTFNKRVWGFSKSTEIKNTFFSSLIITFSLYIDLLCDLRQLIYSLAKIFQPEYVKLNIRIYF